MKKLIALFMGLLAAFFVAWGIKISHPINRPSNGSSGAAETPWYAKKYQGSSEALTEWTLDHDIPLNYVPVPGEDNLYMVIDNNGNITKYRQRIIQNDGSYLWQDINPDIPDNYEPVDGIENVYKLTSEDGSSSYVLYVRNTDDTFCFVPCSSSGIPLDDGKSAENPDDEFVHLAGNVYAKYNENGVLEGYRKISEDENGNPVWKVTDAPNVNVTGNPGYSVPGSSFGEKEPETGFSQETAPSESKSYAADGTYTEREVNTDTVTENGFIRTYETTVISTYDKNGNLLSTKKEGPTLIDEKKIETAAPDKTRIADTLSAEYARVSASVSYDTEKASEVLVKLNAQRTENGLQPLTMDASSESYMLACIYAADMATYDYSSTSSPLYGSLDEIVTRFNITTVVPQANLWKTGDKSAADIHQRFQANEYSRSNRMSNGYTEVGIAIASANGQIYIAEVFLR